MKWKTIPLFISSTFQDMHAERDYLKQNVFPVIEERLLKRNYQLEIIDLRWGVFTDNNKEAIEKELYVLSVCMNELEKSRPYFLAILGNRYGWIPPKQISAEIMQEYGININPEGKSITEMEIISGSLESSVNMKPLFLFRDDTVINLMPAEEKSGYSDYESGRGEDNQKLSNLKERIRQSYPDKTFTYKASWDAKNNQIAGLQEFGEIILDKLWSQLDEDTKDIEHKSDDRVEYDNMLIMSRVTQQMQNSVARKSIIDNIYSSILQETPIHIILSGETGSGKSTIISQLVFEIKEKKEIIPLVHIGGFGSRGKSVDDMIIRFIDLLKLEVETDLPSAEKIPLEELDDIFMQLLYKVSKIKNVAIIIDEIHLMESSERSRYLIWVKGNPPDNCHFVLSGKRCDQTDILFSKPSSIEVVIPDINKTEAKAIILNICQKYHRGLSNELIDALLRKTNNDEKPLSSNPLWLTLATEQINLVRLEDFLKAKESDNSDPEKAIIAMLEDIIDEFPTNIEEMYNYILNYLEAVYGQEKISLFSSLLALSRQGWRHSEIKTISLIAGAAFNDLDISRLLLAFRGNIASVTEDSRMFFISDELKTTIRNRYFEKKEKEQYIHSIISGYLSELPENESIKSAELMYHYIRGRQFSEAKHYFQPNLPEDEYRGAVNSLADQVLFYGTEGTIEDFGVNNLLKDFISADAIEEWDTYQFIIEIITSVYELLKNRIPLSASKYILSTCLPFLQNLVDKGFEDDYIKKILAGGQQRLAEVKSNMGDASEEWNSNINNLEKFKTEYISNPDNIIAQSNYALALFKKGSQTISDGLADEALDDFIEAYKITIETSKLEPENPMHQIGISEILSQMAVIYKFTDNEDKGRKALEIALDSAVTAFNLDTSLNESKGSIGRTLTMLGDFEEWAGKYEEAYNHFYESFKIRHELVLKHPDNIIFMHDLAISNYRLGNILLKTGNAESALQYAKEAEKLFSSISQSDIDNFHWFGDKIRAVALLEELEPKNDDVYQQNISDEKFKELIENYKYRFPVGIYDWGPDSKKSAEHVQKALEEIKERRNQDKENPAIYVDYAITITKLAQAYESMGLYGEALSMVNKSFEILQGLTENNMNILLFIEMSGELNYRKGRILLKMRNRDEASTYAEKALDIYEKLYEMDEDNQDYEYGLEDAEDFWDLFNKK
ncbi:DUF4062 domain-containing protein [Bacteroidota bacterium]